MKNTKPPFIAEDTASAGFDCRAGGLHYLKGELPSEHLNLFASVNLVVLSDEGQEYPVSSTIDSVGEKFPLLSRKPNIGDRETGVC